MIDTLLRVADLLRNLVNTHGDRADQASLASRHALVLAANYVGDLATGLPHDRNAQKAFAIACSEAGGKLRRNYPMLAKEFFAFGLFWSSGAVAQSETSVDQLREHVTKLEGLLAQHYLQLTSRDPRRISRYV
jgi:hypothetical protein